MRLKYSLSGPIRTKNSSRQRLFTMQESVPDMATRKRSASRKKGNGEMPEGNARLNPPDDAGKEPEPGSERAGGNHLSDTPNARKERLRHLARLIRDGKYCVPADAVAEKLIDYYCVPSEILFPTIH
jgi:anti-sigma28 factor (negative regulator of flagellin synthesis)